MTETKVSTCGPNSKLYVVRNASRLPLLYLRTEPDSPSHFRVFEVLNHEAWWEGTKVSLLPLAFLREGLARGQLVLESFLRLPTGRIHTQVYDTTAIVITKGPSAEMINITAPEHQGLLDSWLRPDGYGDFTTMTWHGQRLEGEIITREGDD